MLQVLQTDPNWPHAPQPFRGITRRFILGMALLSCAVVLLGLPLVQIGLAIILPPPIEYRDVPFQVCSPTSTRETCTPLQPTDVFHAGDVVPIMATRCINEAFVGAPNLSYVVNRNVVNVQTGVRTILPDLATSATDAGCQVAITYAHQLPESLAPGTYYLEGVATAYGRFRTANAYFRTQPFVVAR